MAWRLFILVVAAMVEMASAVAQEPAPAEASATAVSPGVPAVIRLVKAGVPHEMIVRAIESSGVTIQATPDDLAALKQAGTSGEVIRAITAGKHGQPASEKEALPDISLRSVRKIYVEKMSNGLDQYLLVEISKQLKSNVVIVLRPEDADALLVGRSEERAGVGAAVAGRVLGLQDTATGIVSLVDGSRRVLLWSSEAGDRTMPGGLLRTGPAKVAERLIRNLKTAIGL